MNSIRFGGIPPLSTQTAPIRPVQFEGRFDRFNKDTFKQKARQLQEEAREHNGPNRMIKAGGFMLLLTALPGSQALVGPLGALTLGGGLWWRHKRKQKDQ